MTRTGTPSNDVELVLGVRATALDPAGAHGHPRRRRAAALRQAAARHRLAGAPRSTCPARTTPAIRYLRTITESDALLRRRCASGGQRGGGRRRLDRAGDRRGGPRARLPRSPSSRWTRCRCAGCSATRSRRSSPTCTGRTAWTSASAPGSRSSAAWAGGSPTWCSTTAPSCRPTWPSSASASARRPSSPRRPASRSTTASSPTQACAPPTRTSSPAAMSRSSFNPLFGKRIRVEHWANALNGGKAAAQVDARPGRRLRPGAVLLLRPVRPGHGVLRLRRAGRLRPGRVPRRSVDCATARRPSSSRSGSRAAGCWPA